MPHFLRPAFAALALIACSAGAPGLAASEHPTGLHVTARIPGPDGRWDLASFDPVRRRVYIAHGSEVIAIEVDSGKANMAFAPGDHLHGVMAAPGTNLVATSNSGDDTARLISADDGKLVASIPVAAPDADAVQFDPKTGLVVVISGDGGALTLIDPQARKAVGSISVGEKLELGAPDGEGRFFVNIESKNEVAAIDLAQRKVLATYALPGCEGPTGLAYVSDHRVISACRNGGVDILDADTGRMIASLKVGEGPDSVIYDPVRQLAYVPSGKTGTLAAIALSGPQDNTVVDTIPTQAGARTGAVDPKTGRIYLPTAEYDAPPAPGQHPTLKPGTFQVLVLDR